MLDFPQVLACKELKMQTAWNHPRFSQEAAHLVSFKVRTWIKWLVSESSGSCVLCPEDDLNLSKKSKNSWIVFYFYFDPPQISESYPQIVSLFSLPAETQTIANWWTVQESWDFRAFLTVTPQIFCALINPVFFLHKTGTTIGFINQNLFNFPRN